MELHAKANLGQEQRKTSIFHIFKFSWTHGLVRDLSLSLLCLPYDYTRPNLSKIPFLLLFGEEGGAWILPPFPYCPISSFFRTFLLLFFLYFSLQLGSSICCIQPFSSMHAPYRPTPPPPSVFCSSQLLCLRARQSRATTNHIVLRCTSMTLASCSFPCRVYIVGLLVLAIVTSKNGCRRF